MSCFTELLKYNLLNNDYTINKLKLKKHYLKVHPDRGGDPEVFKFFRECENNIGNGYANLHQGKKNIIDILKRIFGDNPEVITNILLNVSGFALGFLLSAAIKGASRSQIIIRAKQKGYKKLATLLENFKPKKKTSTGMKKTSTGMKKTSKPKKKNNQTLK